jgi:hypothetical protein
VEKKYKVVAPKSKLMWHRKVVPNVMANQASQEEGCGEVGRQDLKMVHKRDAIDIMPPFREDPTALRTMLFEGEDGEDNEGPMKLKVNPNFRTPTG